MKRVDNIVEQIRHYFMQNGQDCKAVIGISGGKDSTVAAALLCKALGPDCVVAVKMPQGKQPDIEYSNGIIEFLGIKDVYEIDIGPACEATLNSLPSNFRQLPQVYTNIPARERMKVLYAIAAGVHGRVINTGNLSEAYVGYCTKFGDCAGDFAILANFTATEVIDIGLELKIPEKYLYKPPMDGLSGKTDEDNLGFTYKVLDNYILKGITPPSFDIYRNIETRRMRNRHKQFPMPMVKNERCRFDNIYKQLF